MIYKSVLFVLSITICVSASLVGCSDSRYHLDGIKAYFITSSIDIKKDAQHVLSIRINHSRLVHEKRERMGKKWAGSEAEASVGTYLFLKQNDAVAHTDLDSLRVVLFDSDVSEMYTYSMADMVQIDKLYNVADNFIREMTSENFLNASSYLGKEILNDTNQNFIRESLGQIFLPQKLSTIKLSGIKIKDSSASLYVNVDYVNSIKQTYIFTFFVNGDRKIHGITMP